MSNTTTRGTVTATFSRRMQVTLPDGSRVDARIKGRRLKPVCGDFVQLEPLDSESDWLITAIDERKSALTRPNMRGDIETLVANFDLLVVVAAPEPKPDWFIVDRYIGGAELNRVDALLVMNKSDLGIDAYEAELSLFKALGYGALEVSAEQSTGLDGLVAAVRDRTAVFVGQSGVGKSSLINGMIDGEPQRVASISDKHREGRHTTVNSAMLDLRGGGRLIDSPGVRDYAPGLTDDTNVQRVFVEIDKAADDCRFSNCKHLKEPGCAVKERAERGDISERRLESYRRLLRLQNDMTRGRY